MSNPSPGGDDRDGRQTQTQPKPTFPPPPASEGAVKEDGNPLGNGSKERSESRLSHHHQESQTNYIVFDRRHSSDSAIR